MFPCRFPRDEANSAHHVIHGKEMNRRIKKVEEVGGGGMNNLSRGPIQRGRAVTD